MVTCKRDELDGFILDTDDISTYIEHRQMARPYMKQTDCYLPEGQRGNHLHTYEFGNSTRLSDSNPLCSMGCVECLFRLLCKNKE
jgi:hypothetical protein